MLNSSLVDTIFFTKVVHCKWFLPLIDIVNSFLNILVNNHWPYWSENFLFEQLGIFIDSCDQAWLEIPILIAIGVSHKEFVIWAEVIRVTHVAESVVMECVKHLSC